MDQQSHSSWRTSGKFNRGELGSSEQLFLLVNVLKKTLDDSEWPIVLFRLTTLLKTLTKRLVVVLVDEYDTQISCAVQHGYFDGVCKSLRTRRA
jgi:hypothetical protein